MQATPTLLLAVTLGAAACGGKTTQGASDAAVVSNGDARPPDDAPTNDGGAAGGNVYCSLWRGPVSSCDAGPDAGPVQICYAGGGAPICGQLAMDPPIVWGCCTDHQPLDSCVYAGAGCP